MNIFEKIQKQKLDVTIDIVPKLEGSPIAFSECKVEVPHLGKTIMVSIPNNIGIGQNCQMEKLLFEARQIVQLIFEIYIKKHPKGEEKKLKHLQRSKSDLKRLF